MIIENGSSANGKRYSSGNRSCETILYRHNEFPKGMIGPALLLWRKKEETQRQLMIRIHPAMVKEVWHELYFCAKEIGNIRVEDIRFEIGSIDLFGPLSVEALYSILKVGKGSSYKTWNHLRGVPDSSSLPMGAVLDLDLCDPRREYSPPL
jgi:ribonuclease P/MRP protein subunit POP1